MCMRFSIMYPNIFLHLPIVFQGMMVIWQDLGVGHTQMDINVMISTAQSPTSLGSSTINLQRDSQTRSHLETTKRLEI